MRTLLTIISLAFSAHTVVAAESVEIPAKAKAAILKRNPQAQDFQAQAETHFGNKLIEVSYKADAAQEERTLELFTPTGLLLTNEVLMEGYDQMPPPVFSALKTQFGDFKIEKAELIGNPNGAGEEYDIYILSQANHWRVSITDKGQIIEKKSF